MVRPIVKKFPDAISVADAAAADLFAFVSERLKFQKRVDIALTGGTVGILTLASAATLDFNSLDLSGLHIWWGDERFVSSDHEDRNAVQARNAWLRKLEVPAGNVHEFPSSDSLQTIERATVEFGVFFQSEQINFDLMLMGVGPDGHIASLFPGHSAGDSMESVVAETNSPKPPAGRLSFSYSEINRADEIWFTVAGSDKALAVATAFGDNPTELPVGKIHGKEKTVWYVDQTAGNLAWGC